MRLAVMMTFATPFGAHLLVHRKDLVIINAKIIKRLLINCNQVPFSILVMAEEKRI